MKVTRNYSQIQTFVSLLTMNTKERQTQIGSSSTKAAFNMSLFSKPFIHMLDLKDTLELHCADRVLAEKERTAELAQRFFYFVLSKHLTENDRTQTMNRKGNALGSGPWRRQNSFRYEMGFSHTEMYVTSHTSSA